MTRLDVVAIVREVLSDAVRGAGRPATSIDETSHLLAELGLTSLDLADVAIGLEQALELAEFPIMEWLKDQGQRTDAAALTVGSLVDALLIAADRRDASTQHVGTTRSATRSVRTAKVSVAWIAVAVAFSAVTVAALLLAD